MQFSQAVYKSETVVTSADQSMVWPIEVIASHSLSFIYEIPEKKQCYQFFPKNYHDHSTLVCRICEKIKQPHQVVIERKSDGSSMEKNPRLDHISGCDYFNTSRLLGSLTATYEDGKHNPKRKYEYPLLKRQIKEEFTVLFRLDDTRCYRFRVKQKTIERNFIVFYCSFCAYVCKKSKETKARYRYYNNGFVTDPTKFHQPKCAPVLHDDILNEHIPLNSSCVKEIFSQINKAAVPRRSNNRRNPIAVDKHTVLDNQEEPATNIIIVSKVTNDSVDLAKVKFEIEEEAISNVEQIAEVYSQPIKTNFRAVHPVYTEKTITEVEFELTNVKQEADFDVDEKPNFIYPVNEGTRASSNKNNPIIRKKVYSKLLDIPFFSQDEVSVSVFGRTVTVTCQREVSALGVTGALLQYFLELPHSLDISSVQTRWTGEEIVIEIDGLP